MNSKHNTSSLKQLRSQLQADVRRLNAYAKPQRALSFWRKVTLLLRPELSTLLIYRLSHYCYCKRLYGLSRLFYAINLLLHGTSIQPRSTIGAGCLLVHSPGLIIDGHLGDNITLFGHNIIQPTFDANHWSKLPTIGNNCTLGIKSSVLGPIQVADHVTLGPLCLLTEDIVQSYVTVATQGQSLRKIQIKQHSDSHAQQHTTARTQSLLHHRNDLDQEQRSTTSSIV